MMKQSVVQYFSFVKIFSLCWLSADTVLIHCAVLFVAELQNKLQELERQLNELNERRMMLEVELSIIDTSERKVVCYAYQYLDCFLQLAKIQQIFSFLYAHNCNILLHICNLS